eukprot:c19426_g1_i1 orf=524-1789(+)
MGTAVLLPQDCLRPRSRYKHHTSGMIYPPECAPRSKRNPPHLEPSQEAGLLPLPGHGSHSLPITILRRGSETKHFKVRKVPEQRDSNLVSKGAPDVRVYRILQRPRQGEAAAELLQHFVTLDGAKAGSGIEQVKNPPVKKPQTEVLGCTDKYVAAQNGALDIKADGSKQKNRALEAQVLEVSDEGRSVCQSAAVCKPKDASKYTTGVNESICEGSKPSNVKVGVPRPKNSVKEKMRSGPDDLVSSQVWNSFTASRVAMKPCMSKVAGKVNDITCKAVISQHTEENDSMLSRGLARLRRTSTEPQMVKHVAQYRSQVMHISFSDSKLGPHSHGYLDNTGTLSCQERWAGPAYTSSPSPSSLPLPKRCLPNSRLSSLELPPLVKQYSTSVYMQPFLGSSEKGGAWDVAFATKSLRKMLNLDPC